MNINQSEGARFDLWKNSADRVAGQTCWNIPSYSWNIMRNRCKLFPRTVNRYATTVQMLIRGFGNKGTQPASVVIVLNFTSWVIYICIHSLEKPSESVITSLMRVSSWSGAKMETDCKKLILSHRGIFGFSHCSRLCSLISSEQHRRCCGETRENKWKQIQICAVCHCRGSRGESRLERLRKTLNGSYTEKEESNCVSKCNFSIFRNKSCSLTRGAVLPDCLCITFFDLHYS